MSAPNATHHHTLITVVIRDFVSHNSRSQNAHHDRHCGGPACCVLHRRFPIHLFRSLFALLKGIMLKEKITNHDLTEGVGAKVLFSHVRGEQR